MSRIAVSRLNELYQQFSAGEIDRRQFMARASTLGLSAASLAVIFKGIPAAAQDATPAATGQAIQSITREEYTAQLAEAFPFTQDPGAQNTGGVAILGDIASANVTTVLGILADNSPTTDINIGPLFETLLGSSPVDAQYVPGLADRWEIGADGKTYTFFINPNAVWHDGTPLTADDVIFSFDAQSNPETGSSYTSSFTGAVASYSKIDDKTVQVVAADVYAPIIFYGNMYCPIIPKHIWEAVPPANWKTDGGATGADPSRVVGSGPFRFEAISEADGTTTLVRNENYWDTQKAILDTFIFQVWPDESAAIEALRAGDIDIYENVPPSDTQSLIDEENLDVKLYDTFSFSWFGYNMDPAKTVLFQDVKVRQALLYALDRESMVTNIMLGYAEVANGTQPILSVAYAPDQIRTKYTYDVAKAQQLLDEAGWVVGGDDIREKDGQKLSFQMMYGSGSPTTDSIIAALQDYWRAVGVDAQPNPVDFDTVLIPAITENYNYDMCVLGFSWDATGDQSAMFSTDAYGGGFNPMKYSNPAVDDLFTKASVELDDATRIAALVEAANLVNEDAPVGILWFRKDRTGYNVRVHNFEPNAKAGLLWSLPYVWVDA